MRLSTVLRRTRLSGRLWATVPAGSIILFVIAGIATNVSATVLTYVALVGVPISAALALGWLGVGARAGWMIAVGPLFAIAWASQSNLAGQLAAVLLCALSCAALGAMLAAATPARWLAIGIVAMAVADATLVSIDLLQRPNAVLNAVHPVAQLPRLQSENFGSAVMGYGDFFVAGLLGGLMTVTGSVARQRRVALLTAAFAVAFDLLFFAVRELPATVPVASAMIAVLAFERERPLQVGRRGWWAPERLGRRSAPSELSRERSGEGPRRGSAPVRR